MAKAKTQYVCNECGSAFAKWAGQCTDCGAWNSLTEFNPDRGMGPRAGKGAKTGWAGEARFGLLDGERKSFREVGESLGVTAEAARRLVSRAVAGLRDDAERILAV